MNKFEFEGHPLICLVGPSGCGKTTFADYLQKEYGLISVCSYTDRPKRHEGDTDHTYVTPEEFDELHDFVAYTEFNGHRYGATVEQVQNSDIYVIDPPGIETLKKEFRKRGINRKIFVAGLTVSPKTAMTRMKQRGDSDAKIESRLENDAEVFACLDEISDFVFSNEYDGTIEEQMKLLSQSVLHYIRCNLGRI